MDRQAYASLFSCHFLLPLLFSPSSRPSFPFSQPTSPFPGPFLPVSLYPVHFLIETPLNCHRNVYVKLTPQSGQPLKIIRIFWSHHWTVYRSFSLYIIYWRCAYCLELVFGRIFKMSSCWTWPIFVKNSDIRHYGTWFVQLLLTSPTVFNTDLSNFAEFLYI